MTQMLLSRLLAITLREWAPRLKAGHISYGFDDRSGDWLLPGAAGAMDHPLSRARALRCSLHRLVGACVDLLGPGGLIGFEAQADAQPEGGCRLHWRITGQPERRGHGTFEQAVDRLDLAPLAVDAGAGQPLAHGRCPTARAAVALTWQAGSFELDANYRLCQAWSGPVPRRPPFGSRHLWLWQPDAVQAAALSRDALRHGWTVTAVAGADALLQRLARDAAGDSPPDVLLLFPGADTPADLLRQVRRALPARTLAVAAVETGSLWLGQPDALPGYQLACHPLSAADWQAWDQLLRRPTPRPADGRAPVPVLPARVLVAQHDDVPRCLTQSLLQAMGHEVHAARDAVQALDVCLRVAPAVMLLDPALPGVHGDGLVQRLRTLQRTGLAAPCRIVLHASVQEGAAAFAAWGEEVDGFVPQPVSLLALGSEMRRWCTAYLH